MIKEILYKIFRLEPSACPVCEVLREQLYKSEAERKELLQRALAPSTPVETTPVVEEEMKPVGSQYVPWRMRQQMLEVEDRKKAELMRAKDEEMKKLQIEKLEKELDIPSGVVHSLGKVEGLR